jgi:hypothetical protein
MASLCLNMVSKSTETTMVRVIFEKLIQDEMLSKAKYYSVIINKTTAVYFEKKYDDSHQWSERTQ